MGNLSLIWLLAAVLTISLGNTIAPLDIQDSKKSLFSFANGTSADYQKTKADSKPSVTSQSPENIIINVATNMPVDYRGPTTKSFISPSYEDQFVFDFETPIKTILSFCQFIQSCKKGNDSRKTDFGNICCMQCDCSDRCYVTGTCCAEKTNGSQYPYYTDISISLTESCVNTFIKGSDHKSEISSNYLLFQKCADNFDDDQTRRKCLNPDVNKLDEMIPVFSPKSNRHYRNIFCSKCLNDSLDLVMWQTRLSCTNSVFLSSSIQNLADNLSIREFISAYPSCAMIWDPPSNVKKTDSCIKETDIVSVNCTDPILDTLCKKYYAPVRGGNVIYRNMFCMECAVPSKLSGIYHMCLSTRNKIDGMSFTSILSPSIFQKMSLTLDVPKINSCLPPKKYNEILDSCILQTCAISELDMFHFCKPMHLKLMNVHLEYRLKLVLRDYNEDIKTLISVLRYDRNILSIIGIDQSYSSNDESYSSNERIEDICFSDFYDIQNLTSILEVRAIYIVFAEFANLQLEYNEYKKRIEAYNDMTREDKSITFIQIDNTDIVPILEDSVTFVSFDKSDLELDCSNDFAMTKLQACDTITFDENEFLIHDDGKVNIDNIFFHPGQFVPRKSLNGSIKYVQVCLDDYISMRTSIRQKKNAASNTGYGWTQGIKTMMLLLLAVYIINIHAFLC